MRTAVFVLVSGIALAGCAGGGLQFGNTNGTGAVTALQDGAVKIAPPRGYCLDDTATRASSTGDFLLYGTCKAIGKPGPKAPHPAVLTAAVAPGAEGMDATQMAALAEFLGTEEGRRALSRTDSGTDVTIASLQQTADLILVSASDGATGDLAANYSRAIFALSGSLVTLTASGTGADHLTDAEGRALIVDFIAATRAANGDGTPSTTSAPEQAAPPVDDSDKGLRALFNRLL